MSYCFGKIMDLYRIYLLVNWTKIVTKSSKKTSKSQLLKVRKSQKISNTEKNNYQSVYKLLQPLKSGCIKNINAFYVNNTRLSAFEVGPLLEVRAEMYYCRHINSDKFMKALSRYVLLWRLSHN